MIGNLMTFGNHMPTTFQGYMNADERYVSIDSLFVHNESPACIIIKSLLSKTENCSSDISKEQKVWNQENASYHEFVALVKNYDVVYLQAQKLDDPFLYEIIESIDHIIDRDAVIIVFQNYSTITSNEAARRKQMDKQLDYFQRHHQSDKVVLLPIGDLFNQLVANQSSIVDDSGNPTKEGSDIIASVLYEKIRPYIY
jgi:hypothetical protein